MEYDLQLLAARFAVRFAVRCLHQTNSINRFSDLPNNTPKHLNANACVRVMRAYVDVRCNHFPWRKRRKQFCTPLYWKIVVVLSV